MKQPGVQGPDGTDVDGAEHVPFEQRARRAARWVLIVSLVLMAVVAVFMLVRREPIPAEMWLVAIVWAGWVLYTLRTLGREKRP